MKCYSATVVNFNFVALISHISVHSLGMLSKIEILVIRPIVTVLEQCDMQQNL